MSTTELLLEDIKQRRGRAVGYREGRKGFNQRMRYLNRDVRNKNRYLKTRKEKYNARSLLRASVLKD